MFITLGILSTIGNIILFLIVLSLVICLHELGHLYFAKKAGILCHEFSFGMGPKLYSVKKGETFYSIRAIPFGGFVSMSGEELEEEVVKVGDKIRVSFNKHNKIERIVLNEKNPSYQEALAITVNNIDLKNSENLYINEYEVLENAVYVYDKQVIQIAPKNRRFSDKTILQRFLTTFGGPLMNFVLALFVFLIMAFIIGVPNEKSTVIGAVDDKYPAYSILLEGDKIVSINGVEVNSWTGDSNSITSELAKKPENGYEIIVERNGTNVTLERIYPDYLFLGLGFMGSSESDDLIIKSPLYLNTELKPNDEVISINGQVMNTWEDVIAFQIANKQGSNDKEDLFKIKIYRETLSDYNGVVDKITSKDGEFIVEISTTSSSEKITYTIGGSELLLVKEGDTVTEGAALGSGGNYEFEYVVYGEKELNAMGYDQAFDTMIGISGTTKFSFFGAIGNAFVLFWGAATSIIGTLGLLFTSNLVGVSDLGGFVAIFSMTSDAAAAGFVSLLSFIGLLSVNLGIVNLLPIPALDGGRIVFLGYEAITKRKPNQKVENWLHTIVFFLLIALMLYVTYNDILRLFGI